MKLSTVLCFPLFTSYFLSGQTAIDTWERVKIIDVSKKHPKYENEYILERKTGLLTLIGSDSFVQHIDVSIVDDIIALSRMTKAKEIDPFVVYGKDSIWFKEHVDSLWYDFKEKAPDFETHVHENDK